MGIKRRRFHRSGRGPLGSSGRPPVASRSTRSRFWALIADGISSECAATAAVASQPLGLRWFRQAGGMLPAIFRSSAKPLSGRYLSLAEREEIALLLVQRFGLREIGRRLGRSASTISREIRRNAATGGGGLEYRATIAQWHAERFGPAPEVGEACRERAIALLCGREADRRCDLSERRFHSGARRVLEGPPARQEAGSTMGAGVEPGADRPAAADRLSGRREHADKPRSHLPGVIHSESRCTSARVDGVLADRASIEAPRARSRGRGKAFISPEVMISQRPAEVADRAVPGHWERGSYPWIREFGDRHAC